MKRGALYFLLVVIFAVVAVVLSHLIRSARSERELASDASQAISVTTMPLQAPSFIDTIAVTASLRGIHEAKVSAETGGRVIALYGEIGDFFSKEEPLLQLDSSLKSLTAQQAKVAFQKAESDLARAENLFKAQSISDSELEAALLGAKAAEVAWRMAETDYRNTTVRAPFAGTLASRSVELGEMAGPGMPVASLVDLRRVKAEFQLTEKELVATDEGDSVLGAIDALPGLVLQGTITARSLQATEGTRAFTVEATFPGMRGIASGMFLRGFILVNGTGAGFLVPREAVHGSGDDARIYIAEDGKAQARKVHGENPRGAWIVVHGDDLQPGETLIVTASKAIENGAAVSEHGENRP
jgi:membrane fusion protein (multidrug efflux system)